MPDTRGCNSPVWEFSQIQVRISTVFEHDSQSLPQWVEKDHRAVLCSGKPNRETSLFIFNLAFFPAKTASSSLVGDGTRVDLLGNDL